MPKPIPVSRVTEIPQLEARVAELEQQLGEMRQAFEGYNPFREWAQSYLDAGRWAGYRLDEAIKAELLERDQELAALTAERDRLAVALRALSPALEIARAALRDAGEEQG